MRNAGLYIHIPYCIKKCRYCDFVSYPVKDRNEITSFIGGLILEAELYRDQMREIQFDTLFIGGGTPSLIRGMDMIWLLDGLRSVLNISDEAEVTMECNPGTLIRENISDYKRAGINRISIGLQTSDDTLLKRIGRIHTYSDFTESVKHIKKSGITNFNLDVMHGLPGQTAESYLETLKVAVDTGATHISSYSLILEEGTPLYEDVRNGLETLPDENLVADMQDAGISFLKEIGFERYEISNFAKPGFRCRHNENYWKNGEYLGLGPAAHSAIRKKLWTRWSNTESIDGYINSVKNKNFPINTMNEISKTEEMFECIMLGLRTNDGISFEEFRTRFGCELTKVYSDELNECRKNDWIDTERLRKGYLALNARGMDLENLVLHVFMSI